MDEQKIIIKVYDAITNSYYDKEIEYVYDIDQGRKNKIVELESYIARLKEIGVEYQGKWFKCDEEAKTNVTQSMLFIDALIPLTWFTRNGEQGTVTFETKEQFLAFVQVIASKMAEIQNKYYAYKYAIEQATTEEELDQIVFETQRKQ